MHITKIYSEDNINHSVKKTHRKPQERCAYYKNILRRQLKPLSQTDSSKAITKIYSEGNLNHSVNRLTESHKKGVHITKIYSEGNLNHSVKQTHRKPQERCAYYKKMLYYTRSHEVTLLEKIHV